MSELEKAVIKLDGVWPGSDPVKYPYLNLCSGFVCTASENSNSIGTYASFLQARARLENKPAESDWPKWAAGVAQDSDGFWAAHNVKPDPSNFLHQGSDNCEQLSQGHVFGDWKQTWTPRSEPAYKPEDVAFKREDVKWGGKGLPPCGLPVEVFHAGRWVGATVVGSFGKDIVCAPDGGGYFGFTLNAVRPIKTERERVIDLACKKWNPSRGYRESMEHLYDLGMLRMPGDES